MSDTAADDLTVEAIEAALPAERTLGGTVRVYPVAVSTEALTDAWARQDAPEGALVVVDKELSARARRLPWVSVAGRSLAFSVVLHPGLPVEGEGLLWLLGSLAVAEGIAEVSGLPARLKWPNDVLIEGRSVGCVKAQAHLSPAGIESAVITVRVNVGLEDADLPDQHRDHVTSLALHGVNPSRAALLAAILTRMEAAYEGGVTGLLEGYRSTCDTLGQRVVAHLMPMGTAHGRAVDVDERGGLVIDSSGGRGALGLDELKRLEVG